MIRRLAPFGDSGLVHLLQVSERDYEGTAAPFSWSAPPAYLIRYGLNGRPRDTLAALAGAPTTSYKTTALVRATRREVGHYHSFAELAPTVTAAYGVGPCLFLAGFAPSDWADGTALTWVVINVRRGSLEAVVRLSPPEFFLEGSRLEAERHGAAVRAFDSRFAFTISRDDDGAFLVQRYPLPRLTCDRE